MALLTVRTFDDPILRKKAVDIEEITPDIRKLASDMIETMYFSNGIGLAAPQIGVSKRLITIDISQDKESLNPMVFVNPEIIKSKGLCEFEEGCLSIPTFNGTIIRPEQVTIRYQTLDGESRRLPCKGLLARVIQHEIDHLNGILFTDRLEPFWWESEDGFRMSEEHPRFSAQTKFRELKTKVTSG